MKVLIVDDKIEDYTTLKNDLDENGFCFLFAENGRIALEVLNRETVDLILSDILLPELDGYSLLLKCKTDDKLKNVPFVFCSGAFASENDISFGLRLGANGYIRKPVDTKEFLKITGQVTAGHIDKQEKSDISIMKIDNVQALYNKMIVDMLKEKNIELQGLTTRYMLVFDNLDDIIFWLDDKGYFTAVNRQVEKYGYKPEEVVGKHFIEVLTPKSREIAKQYFEKAKISGGNDQYVVEALYKDGTVGILNMRVYTIIKEGKFIGRFGIARDITKFRETEKRLMERELKYDILFHNIPVGVFYYDLNLVLSGFNDRFVQILSSTHEKLMGLDLKKLNDQRVMPAIMAVLGGEEGSYTGYYSATTSSAVIYAELKTAPVYDEDNSVIGGVGLVHDITEQHNTESRLIESYRKQQKFLEGTVDALAAAVEKRDPYTAGHQKRVARLACAIAREMSMDDSTVQCLNIAGILHDIGKIYVPAEILSKPTLLTKAEFAIVKEHPSMGAEILSPIEFPWAVAKIILQHHERIDGSGYPKGIKEKEILLEAKILAVADVVEAMMTHRPYRPAWAADIVLKEIREKKSILYDADIVDACIRLFMEKGFRF